jgi:hypothetical protein
MTRPKSRSPARFRGQPATQGNGPSRASIYPNSTRNLAVLQPLSVSPSSGWSRWWWCDDLLAVIAALEADVVDPEARRALQAVATVIRRAEPQNWHVDTLAGVLVSLARARPVEGYHVGLSLIATALGVGDARL